MWGTNDNNNEQEQEAEKMKKLQELLSTEETYVRSLETCISVCVENNNFNYYGPGFNDILHAGMA